MSHAIPTTSSSSNFQLIFNNALKAYEKRTKSDLLAHPLVAQLQDCNSLDAIQAVIHQQVQQFHQSRGGDESLTKWLDPTMKVLYSLSETLGEGVSLVFSPAKVVFAGVGVLLSAAMDVHASQATLIDIFERMENFIQRLDIYTNVSPTPEMIDIIVKILVEVLSILAIATKEVKQNRMRKYLKKLIGRNEIEDALKRLEKLTNEEVRMATAQVPKATHTVDDRVGVVDRFAGISGDPYRGHSGRHPSGHTAIKFRLKGSTHSGISVRSALDRVRLSQGNAYLMHDVCTDMSRKISLKIRWSGYRSNIYSIPLSTNYHGYVDMQSLARRTSRAIVHFMQTNAISLSWDRVVMHRLEKISPGLWFPVLITH